MAGLKATPKPQYSLVGAEGYKQNLDKISEDIRLLKLVIKQPLIDSFEKVERGESQIREYCWILDKGIPFWACVAHY